MQLVLSMRRESGNDERQLMIKANRRKGRFIATTFGFCHSDLISPSFRLHDNDQNEDRKSTRLNSSHVAISYAVFCLKKKNVRPLHHVDIPTDLLSHV